MIKEMVYMIHENGRICGDRMENLRCPSTITYFKRDILHTFFVLSMFAT
jgi:hypothetical protein